MIKEHKKWEIICFNGLIREQLEEDDYQKIKQAFDDGLDAIRIKDRIFPLKGSLVRLNPEWVDPEKLAKAKEVVDQYHEKIKEKYAKK